MSSDAMITAEAIDATAARLRGHIVETPTHHWRSAAFEHAFAPGTEIVVKLELFQHTGTFKARGALNVMLNLTDAQRQRGVTAVSAGNHAIATAWAARLLGLDAKVAMLRSANPLRVAMCRELGATVEIVDNGQAGFQWCEQRIAKEGRAMVHPFEGQLTSLATATIGREMLRQIDRLDAVVVPIGGGGLASGVAAAIKALRPRCAVYGVEPLGAPTMTRSFELGRPAALDTIATIADSLGAPFVGELTYRLCREHLDDLVLVDDDALRRAQALLFRELKLAVEPAGAATTAAALGPLRERLGGQRIGLIVCGANIDPDTFAAQVRELLPH